MGVFSEVHLFRTLFFCWTHFSIFCILDLMFKGAKITEVKSRKKWMNERRLWVFKQYLLFSNLFSAIVSSFLLSLKKGHFLFGSLIKF